MRWLVVVAGLAACSSPPRPNTGDAPSSGDSGSGGSGSGSGGDAAITGTALVTVHNRATTAVVANAPVVFTNPDLTTTYVHSDVMGNASATIQAGASVTVAYDQTTFMTVMDIQPGDHITLGPGELVPTSVSTTLAFTAYPGATSYRLQSACVPTYVPPGPTTVTFQFCRGGTTNVDLYVIAYVDTVMVATAAAHGLDLSQPITIPNVWTPAVSFQFAYTGIAQHLYATFSDAPENYGVGTNIDGPTYSGAVTVPVDGTAQFVRTDVEIPHASQSIFAKLAPGATSYQLDVGGHLLPYIAGVKYEAATRTASVLSTPTIDADLYQYQISWGDPSSPTTWFVYTHTLAPVVLPALPSDLFDPAPLTGAITYLNVVVVPALTDWDQVKAVLTDLELTPIRPRYDFVQTELVGLQ